MWQELSPKLKQALVAYATKTESCPWRHDYKTTTDVAFEKMLGEDGLYKLTMEALPGHPLVRYRRLPKAALEATEWDEFMKAWTDGDLELTIVPDVKVSTESILQQFVFYGSILRLGGQSDLLKETMATSILSAENFRRLDYQKEAGTVRKLYSNIQQRFGKEMPFDELKSEFRHILSIFQPGELPDIPADKMKIHVSEPFLRISNIDGVHH